MNFSFTEEQEFLRETVRRFLDDKAPIDRIRALMETDQVHDPALWQEMAGLGARETLRLLFTPGDLHGRIAVDLG